jgi:hypothetical protein
MTGTHGTRRHPDSAGLISRGTKRRTRGYEDNLPMRHIIEVLGAVPYKTYRIYEKAL